MKHFLVVLCGNCHFFKCSNGNRSIFSWYGFILMFVNICMIRNIAEQHLKDAKGVLLSIYSHWWSSIDSWNSIHPTAMHHKSCAKPRAHKYTHVKHEYKRHVHVKHTDGKKLQTSGIESCVWRMYIYIHL